MKNQLTTAAQEISRKYKSGDLQSRSSEISTDILNSLVTFLAVLANNPHLLAQMGGLAEKIKNAENENYIIIIREYILEMWSIQGTETSMDEEEKKQREKLRTVFMSQLTIVLVALNELD